MRSVSLNFSFILFLTFCLLYQVYADDYSSLVWTNTYTEANLSKAGKGIKNFFLGKWNDLDFDEKLLQYIKVKAVKDQGIDGYFNPKIRVCDYEGNNCHDLYSGTSCQKIYGTQGSGAGVSAAVFIDWEGDKTKAGVEISHGLEWEWADGVSDEEKVKFANSPKICACSQKSACLSGISATLARLGQGVNIFYPGEMTKVCDTCSWGQGRQKVKCAPIPLAPGPPPFCERIAMLPPQVRIVPLTNEKNDYFDPKVKVIIGDLIGQDGEIGEKLCFPRKSKKDKPEDDHTSGEVKKHSILDRYGTTHYFETYRKKNKLCTEYRGTEGEEKSQRRLQFPVRCFPAPPAPEPKVVKVVDENTLEIKIKMSRENCTQQVNGSYSDSYCTFDISFNASEGMEEIDPRFFRVVKPRIVEKTSRDSNDESNITDIVEDILKKNPQFTILEKYGLTPDIGIHLHNSENYSITNPTEGNKIKSAKLELDDIGLPKIEVRYMRINDQEYSKRKMLCLSGWKPEPEEFILKGKNRKEGTDSILLKSMGVKYIKYNTIYSKESNQLYYFPCNETTDVLAKPQSVLDKIIFNKQGYISIPEENTNRNNCVAEMDDEMGTKQDCNKCKIVYKLVDEKREEECKQGSDGCICFNGICSRSTQYLNKKNNKPFYLRYKEVDCKDKDGRTLKNEKGEIQKCTQLKDQLIKANRSEVFYADKLCKLDLAGLKAKLKEIVKKQLERKKQNIEEKYQKTYDLGGGYTDNLSMYSHIEIEAWGGGETGHMNGGAQSTESRPGIPGDYIKAKLKIDPSHPVIKVKVMEERGEQEDNPSDKHGGTTWIEICDSYKKDCHLLTTVAGGGKYKTCGSRKECKETKIHINDLKIGNPTIVKGTSFTQNNQVAYIENGKINSELVSCTDTFISKKPGAGGCIDKSKGSYSKGSPGHVKIKAMFGKIDESKINFAINEMVDNLKDITINDPFISSLDHNIVNTIKEEIRKELLW